MTKNLKEKLLIKDNLDFGEKIFFTGTFFLPSALPIGAILLLISLIISIKKSYKSILKDKFNYIVLLSIFLILISTINISLLNTPEKLRDYQNSFIFINLFNWIPILLGFIGFQSYLKRQDQRIYFIESLILGSIPILFSCFLQIFGTQGPFKTLFGSIVWFLKPYEEVGGITGIFNNPNYLSFWLIVTLPLVLYITTSKTYENKNLSRFILGSISTLIIIFALLTNSRNAILGLFIIFISKLSLRKSIFTIIFASTVLLFYFISPLTNTNSFTLQIFSQDNNLISKISYFFDVLIHSPRFEIWKSAVHFISQKPILGWGGSTFPYLNSFHNSKILTPIVFTDAQHTHNIFLELAHNFGIPLAILITSAILYLLIRNLIKIKKENIKFDNLQSNAWLLSSFLVLLFHMTDIPYYDGRVSLLISILFAGLRCILNTGKESGLKVS